MPEQRMVMVDWMEGTEPEVEAEAIFIHGDEYVVVSLPDGSFLRAKRDALLDALAEPAAERRAA